MKIIIYDYYKLNLKSKLVIFLLEYKKRLIYKYSAYLLFLEYFSDS